MIRLFEKANFKLYTDINSYVSNKDMISQQEIELLKDETNLKIELLLKENSHLIEIKEKMESDIKMLAQKNYELTLGQQNKIYDIADYEGYSYCVEKDTVCQDIVQNSQKYHSGDDEEEQQTEKFHFDGVISKNGALDFLSHVESGSKIETQLNELINVKFKGEDFEKETNLNISIQEQTKVQEILFGDEIFVKLNDKANMNIQTNTIQEIKKKDTDSINPEEVLMHKTTTEKLDLIRAVKELEQDKLNNQKIVETAQKMIFHSQSNYFTR